MPFQVSISKEVRILRRELYFVWSKDTSKPYPYETKPKYVFDELIYELGLKEFKKRVKK